MGNISGMLTSLNQAAFAKLHSVSRKTVTMWKARGWIVFDGELVDVVASNALLKKYRREGIKAAPAPGNAKPSGNRSGGNKASQAALEGETVAEAAERIALSVAPHDFDEARRIKENYLALLNQLEYDQKSGAVVAVADVAGAVGVQFARLRTRLLAIPAEQAPRLHRLRTVPEVQDALQDIITEALEELAGVGYSAGR